MNQWLKKHLNKRSGLTIETNYSPIMLSWGHLDETSEMPILRANYVEAQSGWSVYATAVELESYKEGIERSWNVFTNS